MQKIKRVFSVYPLHPLFMGLFPVVALLAANIDNTPVSYAFTPALVSLAVSMVAWSMFYLITRKYRKSALAASWFIVLFFSYGHAFDFSGQILRHRFFLAFWSFLFVVGLFYIFRLGKYERKIMFIANVVTAVLVVTSLGQMTAYKIKTVFMSSSIPDYITSFDYGKATKPQKLPDIYYFIVDAYASEWSYKEFFKADISGFIKDLDERGFYTVPYSTSNYPRTIYSLPSTFNLDYLDTLVGPLQSQINLATPELLENNRLIHFMKERGYKTIFLGSGITATIQNKYADENINYLPLGSEFANILYETTVLETVTEHLKLFDVRKESYTRTKYEMQKIEEIASQPEATFALAHLVIPHYPYVFDTDGTYVSYSLEQERGNNESYVRQTYYLNKALIKLIDQVLKKSEIAPIIVIHSDHGSGMTANTKLWDSYDQSRRDYYIRERMRNFTTVLLPGLSKEKIPSDLTPVNIWRLVFNTYFGTNLELLPNRNIFNRDEVPGFSDVTKIAAYDK